MNDENEPVQGQSTWSVNCRQRIHQYFDERYREAKTDKQRYDVEKTRAMAIAYVLHYANDGYETLAIEAPFDLPIVNTADGSHVGRNYNGIVDCALRDRQGRIFITDHKTASSVGAVYWKELDTNPQLTRYWLAARQCGYKIEGFLWDVILKPTISPKDLTKKAFEEIERDGTYCGIPVKPEWLPPEGEKKETPRLYGIRVHSEYLKDPNRFFHRRPFYRTADQLLSYMDDLRNIAVTAEALSTEEGARNCHPNWHACKTKFNSLCDYHPICCGDDPEKERYQPATSRRDGIEWSEGAISNSQESCLLTCKRKWRFQYVEKIAPKESEYESSLAIGTMLHAALEVFLEDRLVDEQERMILEEPT